MYSFVSYISYCTINSKVFQRFAANHSELIADAWGGQLIRAGAREPGGGKGGNPPNFLSQWDGYACAPPKFCQSLGISTFLPPPPPEKNRSRAPESGNHRPMRHPWGTCMERQHITVLLTACMVIFAHAPCNQGPAEPRTNPKAAPRSK